MTLARLRVHVLFEHGTDRQPFGSAWLRLLLPLDHPSTWSRIEARFVLDYDGGPTDVVLVDRRHAAGGHWLDAYPFVQLHQASLFYGVASTQLGNASIQTDGPEVGLHERARRSEILAYYDDILLRRFRATRVAWEWWQGRPPCVRAGRAL